jgi:hypothetical protein
VVVGQRRLMQQTSGPAATRSGDRSASSAVVSLGKASGGLVADRWVPGEIGLARAASNGAAATCAALSIDAVPTGFASSRSWLQARQRRSNCRAALSAGGSSEERG